MLERNFLIKQITSKDCFGYLSPQAFKNFVYKTYIKVVCQDERAVFLSLGSPTDNVAENELGISGLHLKALGLKENDIVTVTEIHQLPEVTSVKVSPLTENDYDILDLVANDVQASLLSQLKVVANGQNFVAWVTNSISIMLHTEYIFPISPGILDDMTEVVIVKPNPVQKSYQGNMQDTFSEDRPPEGLTEAHRQVKHKSQNIECDILEKYLYEKSDLILRLVPISSLTKLHELLLGNMSMFSVFVSRRNLPLEWSVEDSSANMIVCGFKRLKSDMFDDSVVYVRFCIIEDFTDNFNRTDLFMEDNVFVHDDLFKWLNCNIGERLFMKPVSYLNLPTVKEIIIRFNHKLDDNMKELFLKQLADSCDKHHFVLNREVPIIFSKDTHCKLEFVPSEAKMCVVDPDFLRDCKINANDGVFCYNKEIITSASEDGFSFNISNFDDIMEECKVLLSAKMKYRSHRQNILITGKPGTGKSALLGIITNQLSKEPYFAYVETISCKTLKGKTMESLHKVFSGAFANLVSHQPSVLLLDDVHIMCKCVSDSKDTATMYFNKVSEMLHNMFYFHTSNNFITIIATIPSVFSLNKNLYESRGAHLFQRICEITDLNKSDKRKAMSLLLSEYDLRDLNFEQLVLKMEGFAMQDIIDFSKKAIFFALKEGQEEKCVEGKHPITQNHCIEALKHTVVLSLDNINLHSPGERDFTDIGGLDDVKKMLVETLFWPAKYANIFDNAPLRLQSGLLLYGPPGTGKTILAGAAAKHCGLRLISVKGPELLSKYIGASEQAVRDIFEKAQCAKPCILFFDEFDSLAPRRGHDNTGVTDRVVNQLLTQLDGIESLSGVSVLAATSRPDLLDPALLRPGRLDRQVKCALPDKDARLDILKVLSKSMQLACDVDLVSIAARSEGFSGADLQSVLYSAQLSAVAHLFTDDKGATGADLSEVTQLHLDNALKKTRPSLSKRELSKYSRIYRQFEGGNLPKVEVGTKATLA